MKIYSRHRCERKHRNYLNLAKCMFPRAVWIQGSGPIAVVAWCKQPSITLWTDLAEANKSKAFIDRIGCGSGCGRRHELIRLIDPNKETN